jgi:hypothetical protein
MERNIKLLFFVFPLLLTTLACQAISSAGDTYQESKEALEAVSTRAEGAATQHPGLLETAGSFVLEEGQSLASTAQAFASQNPGLLETARALAEEQGEIVLGTAQAMATEHPGLVETAKAMLSAGTGPQSPIPDVPVLSAKPIEIHYGSGEALSYSTEIPYQEAIDFYKTEMPAYGWELDTAVSFEEADMASLVYTRPGRSATITISISEATGQTMVMIYSDPR